MAEQFDLTALRSRLDNAATQRQRDMAQRGACNECHFYAEYSGCKVKPIRAAFYEPATGTRAGIFPDRVNVDKARPLCNGAFFIPRALIYEKGVKIAAIVAFGLISYIALLVGFRSPEIGRWLFYRGLALASFLAITWFAIRAWRMRP